MEEQVEDLMQGLKLLAADDNSVNRTLLAALAANLGASCDTASNGAEAISLALDGRYDCIILDLHMPEVDGYTAAQAILQLSDAPPLVAFSADEDTDTREKVKQAGFIGMLRKPLSESRLAEAVTRAVRGDLVDETDSEIPSSPVSGLAYDVQAAVEAAGGNTELARELFDMLRADLRIKREQLQGLDTARETMIDLVHQIHGAASHCRAEPLRLAAARLETELRNADGDITRTGLLRERQQRLMEQIDHVLSLPQPFSDGES